MLPSRLRAERLGEHPPRIGLLSNPAGAVLCMYAHLLRRRRRPRVAEHARTAAATRPAARAADTVACLLKDVPTAFSESERLVHKLLCACCPFLVGEARHPIPLS